MGIGAIAGTAIGAWYGGAAGAGIGGSIGSGVDQLLEGNPADKQNEANSAEAQKQRDFNREEAEKTRTWQENMRASTYQTTVSDLKAAGLNPMLAYQNGGTSTPGTSATASQASLPQMVNRQQAALNASATQAQILNSYAQIAKTSADTEVSRATADQVRAQTALTTNSAANMEQTIEKTKAEIDQTKQTVYWIRQQTSESTQRQVLIQYQTELAKISQDLEKRKISQTEAETRLADVKTRLSQYELQGAKNQSESDATKWGRNVRPYLKDLGSITNSARDATQSIYMLTR